MDHTAARELFLFIDSDPDLYRQQYLPIIKNLARKIGKGVFNKALAVKLFMYLADSGAKKYNLEMGSPGVNIFSKPTRYFVAAQMARQFMDKWREKEFSKDVMILGKGHNINPIWIPTVDRNTGKKEARRVPTFAESRGGPTEPDLYLSNPKKRLTMQDRGGIVIAPKVIEIVTSLKKYIVTSPAILWGLADGSIFIRGYKGPKPEGNLRYIVYEDTFKAAREKVSLDRPWRHDVKSVTMMHLTRQGLLITSRQAPLWGIS